MKKGIVLTVFFLMCASKIFADKFQLVFNDGSRRYNISYASIKVLDRNNQVLFSSDTDKYGRITININRRGSFKFVVVYRRKSYTKQVTIDNTNIQLKTIVFP